MYQDELYNKRTEAIKRLMREVADAKEMKKEVFKDNTKEYESMPVDEEARTYLLELLQEYLDSPSMGYPIDIEVNEEPDEEEEEEEDYYSESKLFYLSYLDNHDCVVLSDPLVFVDKNVNYGEAEQILYRIHNGLNKAREIEARKLT